MAFAEAVHAYLGHLKDDGDLLSYRITRRKLGLGPSHMLEFHLMLEFEGLAQLDQIFGQVATRSEPLEGLHHAVNSKVSDVNFALYRDFPDPQRQTGQECF